MEVKAYQSVERKGRRKKPVVTLRTRFDRCDGEREVSMSKAAVRKNLRVKEMLELAHLPAMKLGT